MARRLRYLAAVTSMIALSAPVVTAPTVAYAQPDPARARPAPAQTRSDPAPARSDAEPAVRSARRCAPLRPETDFYAGGRVATVLLTVPENPACHTISVAHVMDVDRPGDRCQDFLVIFYPTDGSEPVATEPVTACSTGPRSRPVVLATDVPDGAQYRVLYEIDYLGQDVRFTVRH